MIMVVSVGALDGASASKSGDGRVHLPEGRVLACCASSLGSCSDKTCMRLWPEDSDLPNHQPWAGRSPRSGVGGK